MASASEIEKVLACPASVVFPQADSANVYADRGNVMDGFVKAVLTGTPRAAALAAVADKEDRATCEAIDFRALGGDLHNVRCQVAYVINVRERTVREAGVNIGRNYGPLGPDDLPGTLDIEGQTFDDGEVVEDVKSGYRAVTECVRNPQMQTYGAARMLFTGASEIKCRIRYVRPSGRVVTDPHTFSQFDLECFLDRVEEGMARVRALRRVYLAGDPLNVFRGPHCDYCKAIAWCPEMTRLAHAMLGDLQALEGAIAELTGARAGEAWEKTGEAISMAERIRGTLKPRVRGGELLPLKEERVARAISFEKTTFRQEDAVALLRTLGATDAEIAALYVHTPVTQVRETNDPRAAAAPRRRAKKGEAA